MTDETNRGHPPASLDEHLVSRRGILQGAAGGIAGALAVQLASSTAAGASTFSSSDPVGDTQDWPLAGRPSPLAVSQPVPGFLNPPGGPTPILTLDVRMYGAVGDGTTDDSAAITAAINDSQNAAATYQLTGDPGPAVSRVNVFFPPGVYLIKQPLLNPSPGTILHGDQAVILAADNTIDFFQPIQSDAIIDNLIFYGGRNVFTVINSSGKYITLTNCRFHGQFGSVLVTNNADSITIVMDQFEVLDWDMTSTGHVVDMNSGDDVFLSNGAINTVKQVVFNVAGGNLTCSDILGVPNNGLGTWAACNGGLSFRAYRFRFGGESGGKQAIVTWSTPPELLVANTAGNYIPSKLVLEDCETWGGYVAKFFSLPGLLRLRGNNGGTREIYWDPSIPPDQRQLMGRLFTADVEGNFPETMAGPTSDQQAATMMPLSRGETFEHGNYLTVADRALFIPSVAGGGGAGWGASVFAGNLTNVLSSDVYGEQVRQYTCAIPANTSYIDQGFMTALNGLGAGPFTAVFAFEVLTGTAQVRVHAAGIEREWFLNQGRHVVDLPFWITYASLGTQAWQPGHTYNAGDVAVVSWPSFGPAGVWRCVNPGVSGSTQNPFVNGNSNAQVVDGGVTWEWVQDFSVEFQLNMFGLSKVNVGSIRIFQGHVTVRSWRTVVLGSAPPTQGYWQLGDQVQNTYTISQTYHDWVCIKAGAASSGAWAHSVTYGLGQCVTNAGMVFQCMQAGTSALLGAGPSGGPGTMNIADGNCVWNCIANVAAKFKAVA